MTKSLIFNGNLVSEDKLRIHPENRGMMYGDGCFDTMKVYKRKFLHFSDHYQRLIHGLEYLEMNPFEEEKVFRHLINQLITALELENEEVIVRTQCWREGGRGYYSDSGKANFLITAKKAPRKPESVSFITAETRTVPAKSLSRSFKLSNGINYIKAVQEARAAGADDAIMLTVEDIISETTCANIFWIAGKVIYTPSDKCDLLPGITRKILIDRINSNKYLNLQIDRFPKRYILSPDAMFATNSLWEIMPVSKVDDVEFDTKNQVLQELMSDFEDYKNQHFSE